MRALRALTIRQSLAAAFVALSAGCVGVGLLIAYLGATVSHRREVDRHLRERVAALLHGHQSAGRSGLALAITELGREPENRVWLTFYWSEQTPEVWAGSASEIPRELPRTGEPTSYRIGERHFRGLALPLAGGSAIGVAQDVTHQLVFERRLLIASLAGWALVLALSLWLGMWASGRLVGRLDDLNRALLSLLRGDRSMRMSVRSPGDEFDQVARRFNELLDENERLLGRVREVSSNIAHELRTPLARVRNHLEELLARPRPAQEVEQSLREALEETDSLLATFQGLLSISRIASGAFRDEMLPVDLSRITRDAVELYEPSAEEAGLRLEVDAVPEALVVGDRHLLAQALSNLIDNALKYAPAASTIEVSTRRSDARLELRVADSGPGIPAQDRERALEPFTRLEAARGTAGTGLGLSLVAAVARLHGASLVLADHEPGLEVMLTFQSAESGRAAQPGALASPPPPATEGSSARGRP